MILLAMTRTAPNVPTALRQIAPDASVPIVGSGP
jgi:hypothetical protein